MRFRELAAKSCRRARRRTAVMVAAHAFDASGAAEPTIPLGLDAYRRWEDWPLLRTGVRAYLRSTYDRKGGNERAAITSFMSRSAMMPFSQRSFP